MILGDELADGHVQLRDLLAGTQRVVAVEDLAQLPAPSSTTSTGSGRSTPTAGISYPVEELHDPGEALDANRPGRRRDDLEVLHAGIRPGCE